MISNILELDNYFKKKTNYDPYDIELISNSILFEKINFQEFLKILEIITKKLKLQIEKLAYYNKNLIIAVKF